MASSSGQPGKTFFAQLGTGMAPIAQGKALDICICRYSFIAAPLARAARTIRSWSTPLRISGSEPPI